jgi:recombination protein RecT
MAPNPTRQVTTTKPRDIAAMLETDTVRKRIALSLPKHLTPERFTRIAIMAVQRTPKLLECTPESLLECLYRLSAMGLEPNGRDAHLIPFNQSAYGGRQACVLCTLIVDYKGMVQLVRRSGEVKHMHATAVYDCDQFSFSYGTNHHLRHIPAMTRPEDAAIICAYSYVELTNGGEDFEVMPMEDIITIRDRSQGYKTAAKYAKQDNKPINSPWETDLPAMAAKTAIRRHSKTLPLSPDIREAIETPDAEPFIDVTGDPAGALTMTPRRASFDEETLPGDDVTAPTAELTEGGPAASGELDLTGDGKAEGAKPEPEPVAAAVAAKPEPSAKRAPAPAARSASSSTYGRTPVPGPTKREDDPF